MKSWETETGMGTRGFELLAYEQTALIDDLCKILHQSRPYYDSDFNVIYELLGHLQEVVVIEHDYQIGQNIIQRQKEKRKEERKES